MEIQKSFSKTAFGGFNKEEVTQYIGELMAKSDEQIANLASENESANAQIAELKAIIEEQYQKIVDINAQNEGLVEQSNEKTKKIEELEQKLKPFTDAKISADEIVETAKRQAQELAARSKQQIFESSEKAKSILEQANEKVRELIEPAKQEVQLMLNSASRKAEEIILKAKAQESEQLESVKFQIEETLFQSEENERKTARLIEEAKLEAQKIVAEAKVQSEAEKGNYDKCLKELEIQRSKFLLYLDEIKGSVQAIQIMHLPKSDLESFQMLRQTTTDAIRKKFAMLNNNAKQKN